MYINIHINMHSMFTFIDFQCFQGGEKNGAHDCVGLTLSQSLGLKEKKVIKVSQRERER